jgi:hypothetical protein
MQTVLREAAAVEVQVGERPMYPAVNLLLHTQVVVVVAVVSVMVQVASLVAIPLVPEEQVRLQVQVQAAVATKMVQLFLEMVGLAVLTAHQEPTARLHLAQIMAQPQVAV